MSKAIISRNRIIVPGRRTRAFGFQTWPATTSQHKDGGILNEAYSSRDQFELVLHHELAKALGELNWFPA